MVWSCLIPSWLQQVHPVLGWLRPSDEFLQSKEAELLAGVRSINECHLVEIGPVVDANGDSILTYIANKAAEGTCTPLVLVHGFGCGAGIWCNNIDALAKDRTVYIIDVIGFGRSSRPRFSSDPAEVEEQFVRCLEAWRKVMGLESFYLLGHSFGGYISMLYSMKYPNRVVHLVLGDPWGVPARPPCHRLPVWARPIEIGAALVLPLSALRIFGPLSYLYLRLVPPFRTNNFERSVNNATLATIDYFYHLNIRSPSGEEAFHRLMTGVAWAKRPLLPRIHLLRPEVSMTILYGEHSWIWKSSGFIIQKLRRNSYVDVQVIANSGHNVSSDMPQVFNALVRRVLNSVDSGEIPANSLTVKLPATVCNEACGSATRSSASCLVDESTRFTSHDWKETSMCHYDVANSIEREVNAGSDCYDTVSFAENVTLSPTLKEPKILISCHDETD